MNPRLIAKKQSNRAKSIGTANSRRGQINNVDNVNKIDDTEEMPIKEKPSDVITHEQRCEIESLYKMQQAVWCLMELELTSIILFFAPLLIIRFFNITFLQNRATLCSSLLLKIGKNNSPPLHKYLLNIKNITFEEIEKFSYEEADGHIQDLKKKLVVTSKLSQLTVYTRRISIIYAMLGLLSCAFFYMNNSNDNNNSGLLGKAEFYIFLILFQILSALSNTQNFTFDHTQDKKLRKLHENLNTLVKNINLTWTKHEKEKLWNSYFILSTKQDQFHIPSKVLSNLISLVLKNHGISTVLLKDSAKISVYGDIALDEQQAEKIAAEIHASVQAFADIETLKEQLYALAKKLQLAFVYKQTPNKLLPNFDALASTNENTNPIIYQKLQGLFKNNIHITDSRITIKQTNPIPADQFNELILFLEKNPIFITVTPEATGLPTSLTPTSSTLFSPKRKKTENPNQHTSTTDNAKEVSAPLEKALPVKPVKQHLIYKWPSGKEYDPSKPTALQNVKPFTADSLPKNKFFATSLLTEEDFAKSSNTYLVERFKQKIETPKLARRQGAQGFVLNLFGTSYDSQGNPFNIDGKIKVKGKEVGDVRAYFEYEVNEDNQVLCVIKKVKFNAHKKVK